MNTILIVKFMKNKSTKFSNMWIINTLYLHLKVVGICQDSIFVLAAEFKYILTPVSIRQESMEHAFSAQVSVAVDLNIGVVPFTFKTMNDILSITYYSLLNLEQSVFILYIVKSVEKNEATWKMLNSKLL